MLNKITIKNIFDKITFSSQLLKAARIFHFTKINPEPLDITGEKCLLLAPHPDDETFGCGGMLIKYPQNFHIICITDGGCGGYLLTEDENRSVRKDEFHQAMEFYGINSFSFMDIQDRKLVYNYEKFKPLDISGYDMVFLPNYFDQHKDHKAVTVLLQKLMKTKKYKSGLRLVFYELWSALPVINKYLDISPIMEKKKEVLNIYSSQHKYLDFVNGIIGLNQYRGMLTSVGYAEGYCVMDVNTFLNL